MKKYIAMAILCAVMCTACHNHNHDAHEGLEHAHEGTEHAHGTPEDAHSGEEAHAGEEAGGHSEIILAPEMAAEAGVKTAVVKPGPFNAAIHTSGVLLPSGSGEAALAAKTSGILSWAGTTPAPGRRVSSKEAIAYVSAAGMADGDAISRAGITYETAKKEYERARLLREDKIISEREFNRIEAEYLTALNAYRGASDGKHAAGMAVSSPIDGYIKTILKQEGEFVSAGETVASVTQDFKLRLQADLPERYATLASSISGANFKTSYDERIWNTAELSGKVVARARSIEPSSAYLPVTFEFDNGKAGMVAGSYAEIWLITDTRENVISVPESALTEEQGEFFVYVKLDEECYHKTPVKLGERNGSTVEILSGLEGGENLVVEGAYHVKLASASVIPGHTHNH